MKINTQLIKDLEPCYNRFNNYLQHYSTFDGDIQQFIALENISYSDKVWVIMRLFNKKQKIKFAIKCASSVLHIYESKYPGDNRPRKAIEATSNWLLNRTKKRKKTDYTSVDYIAANAAVYAAAAATNSSYAAAAKIKQQKQLNLQFAVEVAMERAKP